MDVRFEDMRRVWDADKIAIHFPGEGPEDTESMNPEDYKETDVRQVRTFVELARRGGYVWAEYGPDQETKVGKVKPGTTPKIVRCAWRDRYPGRVAKLKTIQLTKVKLVPPIRYKYLRACTPRQLTISTWPAAGDRLMAIVEGLRPRRSWGVLVPAQQETLCAEYLRRPQTKGVPRMHHLLMPVGRTLKDVDIYGITPRGRRILAQVTYSRPERVPGKVEALRRNAAPDTDLLFFGDCEDIHKERGVTFVPAGLVWEWAKTEAHYLTAILDS
jgi:hypothetical protein